MVRWQQDLLSRFPLWHIRVLNFVLINEFPSMMFCNFIYQVISRQFVSPFYNCRQLSGDKTAVCSVSADCRVMWSFSLDNLTQRFTLHLPDNIVFIRKRNRGQHEVLLDSLIDSVSSFAWGKLYLNWTLFILCISTTFHFSWNVPTR